MNNKKLFNDNWRFLKLGVDAHHEEAYAKREDFKPVDLPHDWLIFDTNNLYEDSTGWYLKTFIADTSMVAGSTFLRFEGVYMDSSVYLNGEKIYRWKYGYSTFDVDLSGKLIEGENELLIKVRYKSPNSRWYSGAGIYRDVWMYSTGTEYIPLDSTYIHTSKSGDGYDLDIETEVAAPDGSQVRYTVGVREAIDGVAGPCSEMTELTTAIVKNGWVEISMHVSNPLEWDLDSPNLYVIGIDLNNGGDTDEVTIGFKDAVFTTDKGFFLNGKQVKLHGVCEHHDLGALGAAYNSAAMKRKFLTLRQMGVNSVRTSHNMPAVDMLNLADEMGFLIVDELLDMWETPKTEYDYARFFDKWIEKDVASWVRRDRNHASLLMWSIGNEIYDTHASDHGVEITKRLYSGVRHHDPKENCPVTIGSNYMQWEGAQNCTDVVKLAGYNYGERLYDEHRAKFKDWLMYGSETSSIVQSRGIYHFPLEIGCLSEVDMQCSSLGNSLTSWGARSHNHCIADDRDHEFIAGMYLWSGFDYIGEPTPYQTKNSYFGQIDTAGFPKDSFYIYKAEWVDAKIDPFVHVYPYWCFNPGQEIDVLAATNGASVELFVNGVSQGRHGIDHTQGVDQLGKWKVIYEPGYIEAIAYDEDGKEIARDRQESFGEATEIVLETDKTVYKASGEDIVFVSVSVRDANGVPVANATNYIDIEVEGSGRLVGCDNGDSADFDQFKSSHRRLFSGKLLAMVATDVTAGDITVTASSEGLKSSSLTVKTESAAIREGSCHSYKIESAQNEAVVPVRDIKITVDSNKFTAEKNVISFTAEILPANATDKDVIWSICNNTGVEIKSVKLEETTRESNIIYGTLTAISDGEFRLRAMSKASTNTVKVISVQAFIAEGLGCAYINPYEYVSAGLYTKTFGNLYAGLEKGIAMKGEGLDGASYENIDFGDYGTDEFTIDVFAFDDTYPISMWLGEPGTGELLDTFIYKKKSIWNVYQPETYKLPRRIKGVQTISLSAEIGLNIRGFEFKYTEKAYGRLDAAECDSLYGDKFEKCEKAVKGIGNNVNVGFTNMNFGEKGASKITIFGQTPLEKNTIHIKFTDADGNKDTRILEFPGGVNECSFDIEPLVGAGVVEFVFLPGSEFDFDGFLFE